MLSNDLRSLECWFQKCIEGRAEFTREGAENFVLQLRRARDDAEQLEQSTVAPVSRAGSAITIEDNVLLFPVVRRSVPTGSPEGGAA